MTVASLRYAPEFRIAINEAPIPAALRASITSVSHQTGLEGADRVELDLVNENLRWLDDPLLALDNDLALHIGYAPDPLEQMFVGEIVGHTASFPSSGVPALTIAAQDRLERLQRGQKLRWFAAPVPSVGNFPLPDPIVADMVSVENGFVPIVDPVGAALSVLLTGATLVVSPGDPDAGQRVIRIQAGESDFDFLQRVARENGWEMFVDHTGRIGGHQLRFQSALDRLTPEMTLTYGRSLLDFTPRISKVGQIVSVTAYVWVSPIKTMFTITVGWDWDRMNLTLDILPELIPTLSGPSTYVIREPVTPISAPRQILSELIPKLNQRLTGSGSAIGDPRIRAGTVLRLKGLGVQFGGLYRVTSATHTLDSGGYRTNFEVRKEIWFGSIPLPEQGAVPIRVSAPFAS